MLASWSDDERSVRIYVTASMVPPRHHEAWAIAQLEPRPPAEEIDDLLEQITNHILDNLHL